MQESPLRATIIMEYPVARGSNAPANKGKTEKEGV